MSTLQLEDPFLSGDEAVRTNDLFVDKVCAPVDLLPGFASFLELCSFLVLFESISVPSLHENFESDESSGGIVSDRQKLNIVVDECLDRRI
jgi:hypothetical protein